MLATVVTQAAPTIPWYSTTEQQPFSERTALTGPTVGDALVLTIRADRPRQILDGWGGCFNELGWQSLSILDEPQRREVLAALFNPTDGCAFDLCRMPIGASDYALNYYSLNDTPGDYAMAHFSIERDRLMLIPYIQAARAIRPNLRVWGSPWTPPAWMKTNDQYYQGAINMEPKNLQAYALYLEKYVRAYRAEGITIVGIHYQNEPRHLPGFPSCGWNGNDTRTFIANYLGPQFERSGLGAEIWLGTINGNKDDDTEYAEYVETVLSDPTAARYVTGCGFQWYGITSVEKMKAAFPGKKMMQTEARCGDGKNDWAYAVSTFSDMAWYFARGANAYMQWNMVLHQDGLSTWGWKQNAMVSINPLKKTITYNPQFYAVKHLSRFIHAGATYLPCDGADELHPIAFRNTDGTVAVAFYNAGPQRPVRIVQGQATWVATVLARSFNTIVFPAD